MGKHPPPFTFFKRGVQVSLGPAGSPLLLTQHNPHVRKAHLGEACSEPLRCHFLLFFCLVFGLKESTTISTTTA